MARKIIVVTCRLYPESFVDLQDDFDLIFPHDEFFTHESIRPYLHDAYALLPTYGFKVTKDIIDQCPNLQIIANFGAGYDNIDVSYADTRHITVTNSPLPIVEPTAEMAYTLMLAAARRVVDCDRRIRGNSLRINVLHNLGVTLYGKTIGIIGMGHIGQALTRYARASNMKILYTQRHQLDGDVECGLGAEYVSLATLLRRSDFVSVHVPLNDATYHLIDAPQLTLMKPTAILVNTSRGPVVHERALIDALRNGKIWAAGLDVFESEPLISEELKLLPNVVLSPHSGTATIDTRIAMGRFAAEQILKFSRGSHEIARVGASFI